MIPDPEYKSYRNRIEEKLKKILPERTEPPETLHRAMRYSVLNGGKRIRPVLTLATGSMFTDDVQQHVPPACAVELIHSYSLIHDDLPSMDDDDLRRGKPACHIKFNEATAILAGDGLLTLAFEVLASHSEERGMGTRLCREMATWAGSKYLVGGQQIDLEPAEKKQTVEQLEDLHSRKTGGLMRAAVRLGAISGGAGEAELERLTHAAASLGLAFQIVDDVLDVSGTEEELGKQPGKDEDNDRQTFPELMGVDASKKLAREKINDVKDALKPFGDRAKLLENIAEFVLNRNF